MDDFNDNQNNEFNYQGINTNKSKKKKFSSKLKRKLIFKILVSILCVSIIGNLFGFVIGFYIPNIKNYFDNDVVSFESDKKNNSNPILNVSDSVVLVSSTPAESINSFFGNSNEMTNQNVGSGIIFHQTKDKVYIVTNYHVISGAKSVNISFGENKYILANLVGKHQISDIAVISINREDLTRIGVQSVKTAYFGNSDTLNVGDQVIAVGNTFGDGNTATRGIVSVVQKDIPVTETETLSVIQTDAAINVGNDGGPLINSRGEVIGINTAKYAYASVEGVGYSISSNKAKPIIEEIMNRNGQPCLGVTVMAITEEIAAANDLPEMGVLVESTTRGGAASIAGIQVGDVITSFNSKPIFTPAQLSEAVNKSNVGDIVEIKVIRNGLQQLTIKAKLQQDKLNNF